MGSAVGRSFAGALFHCLQLQEVLWWFAVCDCSDWCQNNSGDVMSYS